jgi:nicotinate phosphoribosyltransferase
VEVADALGDDLWGVRLDTSGSLVDYGLERVMADAPPGVSVELARLVRSALDDAGHEHVRIVASGGFDAERIREFEAADAPVDSYGVGSALLRGANDFTCDIVRVDGRPCAKVGREERPSPRLEPVN